MNLDSVGIPNISDIIETMIFRELDLYLAVNFLTKFLFWKILLNFLNKNAIPKTTVNKITKIMILIGSDGKILLKNAIIKSEA